MYLKNIIRKDPFEAICEIYRNLDVENKILSFIPNPKDIILMRDEMIASGRFENNIKKCSDRDLLKIINESINYLTL